MTPRAGGFDAEAARQTAREAGKSAAIIMWFNTLGWAILAIGSDLTTLGTVGAVFLGGSGAAIGSLLWVRGFAPMEAPE